MKAIVQDTYGGPEVLRLEDVPDPVPGEGRVLVRVHAAGVDAGVRHLVSGDPLMVRLATGLRAPRQRIPGADLAGVVEAVGAGVTRIRVGDEVLGIGRGAYAELALAPEAKLVTKPAGVSFEQAAATPISGLTALQAVRDSGRVRAGQRVLVIGASGGVGSFAVQVAVALGATVTGMCSAGKAEFVRRLGAADVMDYRTEDVDAREPAFDVVIDTAGRRPLRTLARALAPDGRLVIVGGDGGGRVTGGFGRTFRAPMAAPFLRRSMTGLVSRERLDHLQDLNGLLESGAVVPAVDRAYPLADTAAALQAFADGSVRGKAVVTV